MKKFFILLGLIVMFSGAAFAQMQAGSVVENVPVTVFKQDNLFGLKDAEGNIIVEPQYKKMIKLGNSSFIVQKRSKFGLTDYSGNILVPVKYWANILKSAEAANTHFMMKQEKKFFRGNILQ